MRRSLTSRAHARAGGQLVGGAWSGLPPLSSATRLPSFTNLMPYSTDKNSIICNTIQTCFEVDLCGTDRQKPHHLVPTGRVLSCLSPACRARGPAWCFRSMRRSMARTLFGVSSRPVRPLVYLCCSLFGPASVT